ncbi:MAG TPA: hypothetical protein VFZ43_10755 [Anaerolineales bacterium]
MSKAIQKTDLRFAATFIDVLNKGAVLIQNEDDLIALLPSPTAKEAEKPIGNTDINQADPSDTDYLVDLLMKCYPDMPPASADALARAGVMETSLQVVQETRNAITEANSDFVVVTLFTLFEEKLNDLRELIHGNPAFIKAIQLSRPDWN